MSDWKTPGEILGNLADWVMVGGTIIVILCLLILAGVRPPGEGPAQGRPAAAAK